MFAVKVSEGFTAFLKIVFQSNKETPHLKFLIHQGTSWEKNKTNKIKIFYVLVNEHKKQTQNKNTKRIKPRDWYYVEADKPWLNVIS